MVALVLLPTGLSVALIAGLRLARVLLTTLFGLFAILGIVAALAGGWAVALLFLGAGWFLLVLAIEDFLKRLAVLRAILGDRFWPLALRGLEPDCFWSRDWPLCSLPG